MFQFYELRKKLVVKELYSNNDPSHSNQINLPLMDHQVWVIKIKNNNNNKLMKKTINQQ